MSSVRHRGSMNGISELPARKRDRFSAGQRRWKFTLGRGYGAQGRSRTTDTAIFSRMLYQLSYLGAGESGVISPGRRGVQPSSSTLGQIAARRVLVQLRRGAGDGVGAVEPAAEIDVGAARRAERAVAGDLGRTIADGAGFAQLGLSIRQAQEGRVGSDFGIKGRPVRPARSARATESCARAAATSGAQVKPRAR